MSKRPVRDILLVLLLLTLILNSSNSQVVKSQPVRLMFYNVENFFDTFDDTLTDDNGTRLLLLVFVRLKTGKCSKILFMALIYQNLITVSFMKNHQIEEE